MCPMVFELSIELLTFFFNKSLMMRISEDVRQIIADSWYAFGLCWFALSVFRRF